MRLENRIGETRVMKNGLKATIINYYNCHHLDVQFENGIIVKDKKYCNFLDNKIKCPMIFEHFDSYIKVINPNTKTKSEFLIDHDDVYLLQDKFWCVNADGYIGNTKHKIQLHRLIMNPSEDMQVDHINGIKTDNRKCNLRICTMQQNRCNQKIKNGKYKGISFHNQTKKWQAIIKNNNKVFYLGLFLTPEQAALAYNEGAIKYHGEFARLNKVTI